MIFARPLAANASSSALIAASKIENTPNNMTTHVSHDGCPLTYETAKDLPTFQKWQFSQKPNQGRV